MKYHKQVTKFVTPEDINYPDLLDISPFKEMSEGLIEPSIEWMYWDKQFMLTGWRPMTEKERATTDRNAERSRIAREAKKMKAEERERAEYERLRKKFEDA